MISLRGQTSYVCDFGFQVKLTMKFMILVVNFSLNSITIRVMSAEENVHR